ncbi:ligase-associated DNA damage response endonuclease PdeM [Synechococcus sp. CCY 9618]|uniref:ligase-associated DNA damage response endonuclease PdeM n=1 Tax=Synechococcus sp. CCY 9618 TaxID=2815602 RepID=UPI001C213E9D|nr:ligase-associated DNA damage response endonuclease PdeM [Synechococcus sp. CCY 9618]
MSGAACAEFLWRGHRLQLLAGRAAWDPQQGLLLVADLHLGKAETFQSQGIPLPSDGDGATLNALLALAHHHQPREVVVLGDLIHSRLGLTRELRQKLLALPALMGCPLRLIGGNHERGCWLEGLVQEPSTATGPLWLSHAPEPRPGQLNVCGHCHPVALVGDGADRLRLPCFAYDRTAEQLVLPAFGLLTGGHPCSQGEALWLVADGAIVPWNPSPRPRNRPRPSLRPRGVNPAA